MKIIVGVYVQCQTMVSWQIHTNKSQVFNRMKLFWVTKGPKITGKWSILLKFRVVLSKQQLSLHKPLIKRTVSNLRLTCKKSCLTAEQRSIRIPSRDNQCCNKVMSFLQDFDSEQIWDATTVLSFTSENWVLTITTFRVWTLTTYSISERRKELLWSKEFHLRKLALGSTQISEQTGNPGFQMNELEFREEKDLQGKEAILSRRDCSHLAEWKQTESPSRGLWASILESDRAEQQREPDNFLKFFSLLDVLIWLSSNQIDK